MRRLVAMAWFSCFLAWASASGPVVSAPPERVVTPGEFVTLVFRVDASSVSTAGVTTVLPPGWRAVRATETIDLSPRATTPIVLTMGVPAFAMAETTEHVRVRVEAPDGVAEASVGLTVATRHDFDLEAPREIILDSDPFTVLVRNTGNVVAAIDVDVRRAGRPIASQRVSVDPGEAVSVGFDLDIEGSYVVTATGADGMLERRTLAVVRLGGPTRTPFSLDGSLAVRATSHARGEAVVRLAGAVSDALRVEARVDAAALDRSHVELQSETVDVRIGPGWRDVFRVGLVSDSIVAATLRRPTWTTGALVAGPVEEPTTFAVAASHAWPDVEVAGAAGWHRGAPIVAMRTDVARENASMAGAWRLQEEVHTWSLRTVADTEVGTTSLDLGGTAFGSERANVTVDLQHLHGSTRFYLQGRLPLVDASAWDGRVGVATTFERDDAGDVRLSGHIGNRERQLRVEYREAFLGDWRFAAAVGGRLDAAGSRLLTEVRIIRTPRPRYASYEVRLQLSPETLQWDAWLATQHERASGPWTWSVSGAWNATDQRLAGTAALERTVAPWTVAVTTRARYDYGLDTDPWAVEVALRARYEWSWAVPEPITALAGGRRAGVVEGRIEGAGAQVGGVRIEVGPYRLETDDVGRFEVALPPGTYDFRLDSRSLPLVARLLDDPSQAVIVAAGERTEVVWRAAQTTVLEGAVLESRGPDAAPDEPTRGVPARLLVVDGEGLRRIVTTGADGRFSVRGLMPGPVTVRLVEVPTGATIIGDAERSVVLGAGSAGSVEFTVQPVRARAQSFTERALRIRSVSLDRSRVPPGSAPLVRVEVAGDADEVVLRYADATAVLAPIDGVWQGRLAVPASLPDGPFAFNAVAVAGTTEASRRAQVEVDGSSPAIEVLTDAPVRAGETLRIEAHAVLDLIALDAWIEPDVAAAFHEATAGQWVAEVLIPRDAPDGISEVRITGTDARGATHTVTQAFRIVTN